MLKQVGKQDRYECKGRGGGEQGLGAPMGSLVAGPREFIRRVHRFRKMVGGGSRQMGVMAAPGALVPPCHWRSENEQPP